MDEEKTKTKSKSISLYGGYYYYGPLLNPGFAVGTSSSSTVKVERITFIPPTSNYLRSQFYIFPIDFFEFDKMTEFTEVPRRDNPKKKTKIYKESFTKESSPHIFRNFLTFSYTENFEDEFYVDNEFYISDIREMDIRHFEYYKRDERYKFSKLYLKDENGNILMFSDFKKESSFYLYVPK